MTSLLNYKGEPVDFIPKFRKPEYWSGKMNKFGVPIPDWGRLIDADDLGFDKNHKEPNGHYFMKVVLPKHTRLIRYGRESGIFTAPKGTKYEELALPYTRESLIYHEYEVIADSITVAVKCEVKRGKIAPGFDYPGGGIQYVHPFSMIKSINKKLIKEII